ncbi:MAG: hypothetical protein DDT32_01245 [Syntrophomonadaceae bacterium]|nr:hypothetical protein [Bacillota bacterium]
MLVCKLCGKKFKSKEALGGHMSGAHLQNKSEDLSLAKPVPLGQSRDRLNQAQETRDMPESNASEPAETGRAIEAVSEELPQPADEEIGKMESIRKLREQGYSARQIKEDFGYARSTVDRVFGKFIEPEAKKEADTGKADSMSLPVLLKDKEIISPEAIMQHYLANGSPDWRLRVEGMMLLRAAQRMNLDDARMIQGLAEAQAKVTQSQLSIFKESMKGETTEVAREAAAEVVQQLIPTLESEMRSLKAQITAGSAPDPVTRMMNAMQAIPRMMQMSQQLMAAMGMRIPGTPPPQQPQSSQGMQSPGWPTQQPAGPGPQPVTKDEIKEAFGDG